MRPKISVSDAHNVTRSGWKGEPSISAVQLGSVVSTASGIQDARVPGGMSCDIKQLTARNP
jgi:hypothetical protein